MSAENVEAARAFVDAVNRGDAEAALRGCHPELIFEPLRTATEGAFVGHDGMRAFLTDTWTTFDVFRVDMGDLRDLGDRVLGIGTIRIRGRGSGVETDIQTAAIAQYRDGLMWRYKDYGEARLALEAAGSSRGGG
jgi:hypothetical protein